MEYQYDTQEDFVSNSLFDGSWLPGARVRNYKRRTNPSSDKFNKK